MTDEDRCPACGKLRTICVCDRLEAHETRTRLLVLQHPQEPDVELGTVPLLTVALPRTTVRVGLSWASLAAALGDDADPKEWGVLFPLSLPEGVTLPPAGRVRVVDRKGAIRTTPVTGLVVLDGTWTQAKTLWWRNPWLLKLARVLVTPKEPSIYGRLRKEPRTTHVSTLESVADALVQNGEDAELREELRRAMRTMVQRARDAHVTR